MRPPPTPTKSSTATPQLDAALKLAKRGIPVFPLHTPTSAGSCSCGKLDCKSIGKHPRTRHGVIDATTDEATIRQWWRRWPDANVGIATGSNSNLVVIDVDPGNGGEESFDELRRELGDAWPEDTYEVLTGGGGSHYYFAYPAGVERIGNRQGVLPGIDVRGDGGYVVTPPSLHRSSRRYEFEHSNPDTPPEMSRELLALIVGKSVRREAVPAPAPGEEPAWLQAIPLAERVQLARPYLAKRSPAVSGEGGHDRTFDVVRDIARSFALDEAEALALLQTEYNPRCIPPWSEEELRHKIDQALTKAAGPEWGSGLAGRAANDGHPADDANQALIDARRSAAALVADVADPAQNAVCAALANVRLLEQLALLLLNEAWTFEHLLSSLRAAAVHRDDVSALRRSVAAIAKCRDDQGSASRPTNTTITPPIAIGSDVELATAILADLRDPGGPELVATQGKLIKYAQDVGLWGPLLQPHLEAAVHRYDGAAMASGSVLALRQHQIKGTIACALAQAFQPDFFEHAVPGIGFANVFVKVSANGSVPIPHSPENRTRVGLKFDLDPNARMPRFRRALWEMFKKDADAKDKIRLLQEFLGACLGGIATRYQRALVLIGDGANGKSVLLSVFCALFPQHAISAIAPQDLKSNYSRGMLAAARLNVVAEIPGADIVNTGAFKAAISGDLLDGRLPYGQPFSFSPTAGHIYSGNNLPGTTDHSHGFWRRILPIKFNRVFAECEQEKHLAEKIVAEEMPGVANWALEGLERLLATGRYTEPASVAAARAEWKRDADPVALFVDDKLTPSTKDETQARTLYRLYVAWAKDNGHRPVASNKFGEQLRSLGHKPVKRSSGRFYRLTPRGGRRDESMADDDRGPSPAAPRNHGKHPVH